MATTLRPFLALLLAAPASAQLFSTPVYPIDELALRFVVADLDGDGHTDAAVTTILHDTIVVLHGDGHGAFAPAATLSPGDGPVGIAAGDVQGNGQLDLVTARGDKNKLAVLLSQGGAAYTAPTQVTVPNSPRDVALADLDGDGDLDALTANTGAALTTVLRNAGGLLQLAQEAGPAFGGGELAKACDLDLDGDLDAVIGSTNSNFVVWLPNDGAGTLGTATVFNSPDNYGRSLAIADFDEDGWPDIIAPPHIFGFGMPVLYSLGGGAFHPVQLLPLIVDAQNVEPADLNGDGHVDLLVGLTLGDVLVLLGDGSGSFKPKDALHVSELMSGLRAVDADEDGRLDVVALANAIHVRLGDGFAGFADPAHIPMQGGGAQGLQAVDMDQDGLQDLVCATSGTATGSVLLSHGDGSFVEKPVLGGESGPEDIAVADLDGNGQLDLVVAAYGAGELSIYHNDGSMRFDAPTLNVDPGDGYPVDVVVGDLGAGPPGPDIVVTLWPPAKTTISIVSADGAGGYLEPVSYVAGTLPRSPQLMDLEPDGDLDIVFLQGSPLKLAALRNTGGVFGTLETWPVGSVDTSPQALALGDMDEDGRLDAVTANPGDDSVSVLLGIPGGFGSATSVPSPGGSPSELDLGDLDGDGHLDVALTCHVGETLAVLRGDGDGALLPAGLSSGAKLGEGVALADFDSDGELDAAQGEYVNSVALHLSGAEPTWLNLGHALAGAGGPPLLEPFGTLESDTQVSLKLSGALSNSTGALFLGLSALNLPFKGGTLVPAPDVIVGGLPTGPTGGWTLTGQLPAGLPSGLTLHMQTWIVDAGGPKGLAASNGLVGTTP